MVAKSPVVEGLEPYEMVIGGEQPEYLPLHVLRSPAPGYAVMSRWVPSDEEREQLLQGADVYLTLWTFGHKYPPTMIHVMRSDVEAEAVKEHLDLDTELNQRLGAMYAAQLLKEKKASEAKPNDEI